MSVPAEESRELDGLIAKPPLQPNRLLRFKVDA
jgi:hypothetical protein